jgi:hypothetical protein
MTDHIEKIDLTVVVFEYDGTYHSWLLESPKTEAVGKSKEEAIDNLKSKVQELIRSLNK